MEGPKSRLTASWTESLCAKGVEGSRERCSMRGPKSRLRRLGVARRQMGLVVQRGLQEWGEIPLQKGLNCRKASALA